MTTENDTPTAPLMILIKPLLSKSHKSHRWISIKFIPEWFVWLLLCSFLLHLFPEMFNRENVIFRAHTLKFLFFCPFFYQNFHFFLLKFATNVGIFCHNVCSFYFFYANLFALFHIDVFDWNLSSEVSTSSTMMNDCHIFQRDQQNFVYCVNFFFMRTQVYKINKTNI